MDRRLQQAEGSALSHVRFAVIGAGRLGASLAVALRERGAELTGFVCATAAGRAQAEAWLGMTAAPGLPELVVARPNHYVLTVPDAVLPAVGQELAAALPQSGDWATAGGRTMSLDAAPRPVVLHTSGATSVSALRPCAEKGALAFAFHPLQTFTEPPSGSRRFAGAGLAVTPLPGPSAAQAQEAGFFLARALGARPFLLPDDRRTLYHAAACVAANYLVTLEYWAERLFVQAGLPEDEALSLFLPLARAALENTERQGPVGALTGPLSRGDGPTITAHLAALAASAPRAERLYRELGLATLDLVRERRELSDAALATLRRLLTGPASNHEPSDQRRAGDRAPSESNQS